MCARKALETCFSMAWNMGSYEYSVAGVTTPRGGDGTARVMGGTANTDPMERSPGKGQSARPVENQI